MYRLEKEMKLLFDFLWSHDGNDSLRRLERHAATDELNPLLGPSVESIDTRTVHGDMYISRSDVDRWAAKVPEPKVCRAFYIVCLFSNRFRIGF